MAALKQIGDIDVVAEISERATTRVYKGYQTSRQRWVLLKVLKPELNRDGQLVDRFQKEAKFVAKIRHPNVVRIYEYHRSNELTYLAMEFVEGLDLQELLLKHKIPPEIAWFILLETTRGLNAAHKKNILHRDIKPSNILLANSGEVKLTDFGMADLKQSVGSNSQSEARGTLRYFSPEQILGEHQDKYSDIFALGATFFEMLAGVPAFHGNGTAEYFKSILNDDPIHYLKKSDVAPTTMLQVCEKMLSKKPSDRFQSCDEVISGLENFRTTHKFNADSDELTKFLRNPESHKSRIEVFQPSTNVATEGHRTYWYLTLLFVAIVMLGYYAFMFKTEQNSKPQDVAVTLNERAVPLMKTTATELEGEDLKTQLSSNTGNTIDADDTTNSLQQKDVQPATSQISGSKAQDNLALKPTVEGEPGYLTIICTPWAYVFVDNDSVGMTPLQTSLKLLAGEHELIFKNPSFPNHKTVIKLDEGQQLNFDFSFWDTVGKLKLDVSPWAEIFIDDVYKDTVPPQESPFIMSPGTHLLKLKHPSLGEWKTTIEVSAGKTIEMQFNLRSLLSQ